MFSKSNKCKFLFLIFLLILIEMPIVASAVSTNWLDDGIPVSVIPNSERIYEIYTPEQLAYISKSVNYESNNFYGFTVKLMNNIDLSEREWTPIGNEESVFLGELDGNNKKIMGLNIGTSKMPSQQYEYVGFFGKYGTNIPPDVVNPMIKNLGIENAQIYCSTLNGKIHAGILGGFINSYIINCYTSGTLMYTSDYINESSYTGGLVGEALSTKSCFSSATVSGGYYSGGLTGFNKNSTECFATGDVNSAGYGGGLAGLSTSYIKNCYSAGKADTGGLIGKLHPNFTDISNITGYYNSDENFTGIGETSAVSPKIIPKTNSYLKSNEFVLELNENTNYQNAFWMFDKRIVNNGYPYRSNAPLDNLYWLDFAVSVAENNNAYEINTPEELAWISAMCQNGETFTDKEIRLNSDLDLSGKLWYPIGRSDTRSFSGRFNGNGYTICGLSIDIKISDDTTTFTWDMPNINYVGLFGWIAEKAVIENVNIDKYSNIVGGSSVGGIAGFNRGKIFKCTNSGKIIGSSNVGGISGYLQPSYGGTPSLKIANCSNSGTIYSSDSSVGGIAGSCSGLSYIENCYNQGIIMGKSYVGGIVGDNNGTSNVIKCYNIAQVIGSMHNTGGIVGNNYANIYDCYNSGQVSGKSFIGGVSGNNYGVITNTYNEGEVTGNLDNYHSLGGITGDNLGIINNCFNTANLSSVLGYTGGIAGLNYKTIKNCYNVGEVNGNSYIGGVVGQNYSSSDVYNCYYLEDCAESGLGTGTGETYLRTENEMKNIEFVNELNNDIIIWGLNPNGYPVFKNELIALPDSEIIIDYFTAVDDNKQIRIFTTLQSEKNICAYLVRYKQDGRIDAVVTENKQAGKIEIEMNIPNNGIFKLFIWEENNCKPFTEFFQL